MGSLFMKATWLLMVWQKDLGGHSKEALFTGLSMRLGIPTVPGLPGP